MSDAKSLRAALRAASQRAPSRLDLPEIGTVYVRHLTAGDMEAIAADRDLPGGKTGRNLARVLCDESGVPLYDVTSEADVAEAAALPYEVAAAVTEHANKIAGIGAKKDDDQGNG